MPRWSSPPSAAGRSIWDAGPTAAPSASRTVRRRSFSSPPPDAEETTRLLEKELHRLPPAQRDVLTLKFWGGLTFAEVAEALDIPQGTAASRYRLALDALRQTLSTSLT